MGKPHQGEVRAIYFSAGQKCLSWRTRAASETHRMWVFSTIRSPSFSDLKINKRQVQQRRGRLNENLRPPDSAKLNLHTFPLQCGAKKLLALNQCAHKPDMMVKGACHATDLGYCAWKKTGSPFFLVLITLRAVFSLFQHKRLQRTQ